jgi:hypothetical protein
MCIHYCKGITILLSTLVGTSMIFNEVPFQQNLREIIKLLNVDFPHPFQYLKFKI